MQSLVSKTFCDWETSGMESENSALQISVDFVACDCCRGIPRSTQADSYCHLDDFV